MSDFQLTKYNLIIVKKTLAVNRVTKFSFKKAVFKQSTDLM